MVESGKYKIYTTPGTDKSTALLEAVLLFHSAGPWDVDKRMAWSNRVGSDEATTKVLCDRIRDYLLSDGRSAAE